MAQFKKNNIQEIQWKIKIGTKKANKYLDVEQNHNIEHKHENQKLKD
jgi:hypothetical protein